MRDDQYELKVPSGTGEQILAQLGDAPAVDLASLKWYTVKRGDTLPAIARRLHVSGADLAEANYMTTRARVAAGQKLMVPHEATVLMAARTDRPVPVAESRATAGGAAQLAQAAATSNRVKVTYKVQQGDTLSSIARSFRTSVASIKTWNPNVALDHITPGERLTIFTRAN